MDEKNKTYTAADFARYHSGTMPPAQMHALEKAALEDPFLADALEGYVHAPAAASDIDELRRRLADKKKNNKLFFLSSLAQNSWWRVAALFIIIAGAGYIFYRLNYGNRENSLAKNEIKRMPEKADSTVALKAEINTPNTDTVRPGDEIAFESQLQQSKPTQTEKAPAPKASMQEPEGEVASRRVAPASAQSNYDGSLKDTIATFKTHQNEFDKNSRAPDNYALRGKVTDEHGNPVPFANITDKARKKGTVTDTAGRFLFHSKDSSLTAMATAPGYEAKKFLLKKDAEPTIAMNKTNDELSEVVVTGYGNQKRKQVNERASTPSVLRGKVAGVETTGTGPKPFPKNDNFNEYLKRNITPIYNDGNERVTGEVLLSFTISRKGHPKNIKVVKSSCEDCEAEAVKLLENGPVWPEAAGSKGTVIIKF